MIIKPLSEIQTQQISEFVNQAKGVSVLDILHLFQQSPKNKKKFKAIFCCLEFTKQNCRVVSC